MKRSETAKLILACTRGNTHVREETPPGWLVPPDSWPERPRLRAGAGVRPDWRTTRPVQRSGNALAPASRPGHRGLGLRAALRHPDLHSHARPLGRSVLGFRRPAGPGGRSCRMVGGRGSDSARAGGGLRGFGRRAHPRWNLPGRGRRRGPGDGGDRMHPFPDPAAHPHPRLRVPHVASLPEAT